MCRDVKKKLDFDIVVSPIENTNINEIENEKLSILFTYDDLKREIEEKPIDYLKLHELQIQIGKLGEAFVFEYECKKLAGTSYLYKIDDSKANDPTNGYDILSFTKDGTPLHIEVKATTGSEDRFYLSSNEYDTAKEMKEKGMTYVIYFVKEVMSKSPVLKKIYEINNNAEYTFKETSYEVTKKV